MISSNRETAFHGLSCLLAIGLLAAFLSCQAPKEEGDYAVRQPIPTSAGLDVAITITEERFQAPAAKVEEGANAPQPVRDWNTPEMKRYKVGPGDSLRVVLYYGIDYVSVEIEVQNDGNITLPLIGTVETLGKTVEEIQVDISDKYKTYYVAPTAIVSVLRYQSHRVYVVGWGVTNAEISLKKRTTLIELVNQIGQATGLIEIDLRGAYLQRGQKIYPVDLKRLLEGDLSLNYELNDNDIIHLRNLKTQKIFVLGEVGRPGSLPMELDDNLFWALSRAGGPTIRAQLHEVRIIRGGLTNPTLITVDINVLFQRRPPRMLSSNDLVALRISADASRHSSMALETLYLQNDDFIFVPRTALAAWNDIIGMINPTLSFLFTTPLLITTNTVLLSNALR